jgi:hypothetical protein
MGGKRVFIVVVVLLVSLFLVYLIHGELNSDDLSIDYDYSYNFSDDELKLLEVGDYNSFSEYGYICLKECAEIDMFFVKITPLFGEFGDNEEYKCLCRPLVHINEKKLNEAILSKNVNVCEEIIYPSVLYDKDYCYLVMAIILEDESICENIEVQSLENSKDACYSQLALVKNDVELCEFVVEENDLLTSKSICEEFVSEGNLPFLVVPS